MSCPHFNSLDSHKAPRLADAVHREECTQCFDNQDGADGIDICLWCFNGGCVGNTDRHHARTHVKRSGHTFTLNVRRTPKRKERDDTEPPQKLTKLAIPEEREEDKYDWTYTLRCWSCAPDGKLLPDVSTHPKVQELVNGVKQSMSSSRQSEVKAWEEEIVPCEHTLTLQQNTDRGHIDQAGLAHCSQCDLRENLWLCLTCGALGCGRAQYGGLGGNGHALAHFQASKHPVAVKLGTITPEGSADIYCYDCNDSKIDPELALHLSTFGINVLTQKKTEKSMTELQIEHNLNYDFSMTGDDGKAMEPVFGPGLTGLGNLGNSCYMASTLQGLFSLSQFQQRYFAPPPQSLSAAHAEACAEALPAQCLECQMIKIADGLLSGRYCKPRPSNDADALHAFSPEMPGADVPVVFQEGVKPNTFKTLVGKGHVEFATMRQQDAEEFLSHLLKALRTHTRRLGREERNEPTEAFKFGMEQRLQCTSCRGVRYRVDEMDLVSVPVPAREISGVQNPDLPRWEDAPLDRCLSIVMEPEELQYRCPVCNRDVAATKSSAFSTFPDVLIVHAKKFQLVNWVPTKLDIPVVLPQDGILVLDKYVGKGLQPGENALPDSVGGAVAVAPTFNPEAMAQLAGMGFPAIRCQKALLATGNEDAEAAMEWLFAHMEDPDIDTPLATVGGASKPEPSSESIAMLADMGFTAAQARKALRETDGNVERAVEWLFNHPDDSGEDNASTEPNAPQVGGSATLPARYRLKAFISHKGPSVHSGHYVAHVRQDDGWVLFNDEKVVKASPESVEALQRLAYLYIFEKL